MESAWRRPSPRYTLGSSRSSRVALDGMEDLQAILLRVDVGNFCCHLVRNLVSLLAVKLMDTLTPVAPSS